MWKQTYSTVLVAALASFVSIAGFGQEGDQPPPSVATKSARNEVRNLQLEVSFEVRDIERILTKLKRASESSKKRISEAAKTTESVTTALDRGDAKQAQSLARQSAEMLIESAKLLEGLLAEEASQRVAAARDLAQQLAQVERELAEEFANEMKPLPKTERGDAPDPKSVERRRSELADRAEQLAWAGQSLQEILRVRSQSTEAADRDAVAQIEAALAETKLLKTIDGMRQVAEMIRKGEFEDARLASLDAGDRMEIAAQRFDAVYRNLVAPEAEDLRKLEQALSDLQNRLGKLETQRQIAAWHRDVLAQLTRAEKLGIAESIRKGLLEQMKTAGNGAKTTFNWPLDDDHYVPPQGYTAELTRLQEAVQAHIQSLLLEEFASDADENTPPKYQDLVERYYEVLSRNNRRRDGKNAPKSGDSSISPKVK